MVITYMRQNGYKKGGKRGKIFYCEICDYSTCDNWKYDRHVLTDKHKRMTNGDDLGDEKGGKGG